MNKYRILLRWQLWRTKRVYLRAVSAEAGALYDSLESELASDDPDRFKEAARKLDIFLCKESESMTEEIKLGSKVVIKECHSMPQVIGKTGVVKALLLVDEENKYPMYVWLEEPIMIEQKAPIGGIVLQIPWQGPHLCRPEELQLVGTGEPEIKGDVPNVFKKAMDEKPPEEGKDGKGN